MALYIKIRRQKLQILDAPDIRPVGLSGLIILRPAGYRIALPDIR
jgi:hypothetical protein